MQEIAVLPEETLGVDRTRKHRKILSLQRLHRRAWDLRLEDHIVHLQPGSFPRRLHLSADLLFVVFPHRDAAHHKFERG